MSFTVEAVRRLVNVPDLTDDFIEGYAEDGYTDAIGVAIAICDYMATGSGSASNQLTVGPITLKKSEGADYWLRVKDNIIKRTLLGVGVPGGLGAAGLTVFGAPTLTGGNCEDQAFVGQFDNPPRSPDCGC